MRFNNSGNSIKKQASCFSKISSFANAQTRVVFPQPISPEKSKPSFLFGLVTKEIAFL